MKNLAEQKRVFNAVLGVIISWIAAVLVFFVLFFAGLFPDASVFGLRIANYVGDDSSGTIEKGDLIFAKDFHAVDRPLEAGKIGAFYTYTRNSLGDITGRELQVKMIDQSYKTADNTSIAIFFHDLDDRDSTQRYAEVPAQNVVGVVYYGFPYLGYAGKALTATFYSGIIFLLVIWLALIIPPIIMLIKKVRVYKRISPFAEGVNTEKFTPEQLFIYRKIRRFLKKSGKMQIKKGINCDKVYKDRLPFCKIRFMDHAIYVVINANFDRLDGRVDRSGYIRIEHAYQLNDAKDRINQLYLTRFKQKNMDTLMQITYNGMPDVMSKF